MKIGDIQYHFLSMEIRSARIRDMHWPATKIDMPFIPRKVQIAHPHTTAQTNSYLQTRWPSLEQRFIMKQKEAPGKWSKKRPSAATNGGVWLEPAEAPATCCSNILPPFRNTCSTLYVYRSSFNFSPARGVFTVLHVGVGALFILVEGDLIVCVVDVRAKTQNCWCGQERTVFSLLVYRFICTSSYPMIEKVQTQCIFCSNHRVSVSITLLHRFITQCILFFLKKIYWSKS